MGSSRTPAGGGIDRGRPTRFRFDGRDLEGFAGDTLASALLANGVDVVSTSPLLGRPRGVLTAGPEEPAAIVEVTAPTADVIAAATMVELVDGLEARPRAGVGRLPPAATPARRGEHRYAHCDVLVVGSGGAGLAAAGEAARRGDRVMLVEQHPWLAGAGATNPGSDVGGASAAASELAEGQDVTILTRATALGVYDAGFVVVHERADAADRLWHVRARRVVLATGAQERPIAFADNDRPGVMLASAAATYVRRFGVRPGARAVVFTTNDSALEAAAALAAAGVDVAAVVDVRGGVREGRPAPPANADVLDGWTVIGTRGGPRLSAVVVSDGGGERVIDADLLAVSGGWDPVGNLHRMIGGGLRYDEERACFVPDGSGPAWLDVVGRAAGDGLPPSPPYWYVPAEDLSRHFVDLQRDATVADIVDALGHGFRSVEHVKRSTYIGTALDQGRTSGVLAAEVVNQALRLDRGAQGPTSARPPSAPVPYSVLAGPARGRLFDPVRTTPIHRWHVDAGAVFESVGQWQRPRFFPRGNEDLEAAVRRECLAVRRAAGVMDASTLGMIDVVGPDAPEFLDRMYTNAMSTLDVGRIRYGLLCGLDGMVVDDGVAMRLAPDRYLVTTTTGGAASVLDRFEEWLQTEWTHLRVYCTSVTEQWATIAVAGPRARDVVAALGTDVDVSAAALPFMHVRDGMVAGIPTRIARVSFSGELAFELNASAWHGLALWEAAIAAGAPLGITPYGTEAMHVLRAEKGYPIVGQDTDGTVTPFDLGMGWIVNEAKGDFVGRRSLHRPDAERRNRRHLVALLPLDRHARLPEGAQVAADPSADAPVPMIGHVTSSYDSSALERSFALALIEGGRERVGRTVFARLAGGPVPATIEDPVLYDPRGERRDG